MHSLSQETVITMLFAVDAAVVAQPWMPSRSTIRDTLPDKTRTKRPNCKLLIDSFAVMITKPADQELAVRANGSHCTVVTVPALAFSNTFTARITAAIV